MNFWLTKVKRWVRMNLFKIFEQKDKQEEMQ
nr:MAG TPA: hypothetical protein [Caudoviricetes sp.]